jgi:hypothetical protein
MKIGGKLLDLRHMSWEKYGGAQEGSEKPVRSFNFEVERS